MALRLQVGASHDAAAPPATLDHAGIAARIPHSGRMCLLDTLQSWSASTIRCTATSHRDTANPLRCGWCAGGAQRHRIRRAGDGAARHPLCGARRRTAPRLPGQRARRAAARAEARRRRRRRSLSPRNAWRATRGQALYAFALHDERETLLVEGRATVILNATRMTPLQGKRALVTGASGALGAAIAQRLAADGATVLLHGNSRPEALEALAAQHPRRRRPCRVPGLRPHQRRGGSGRLHADARRRTGADHRQQRRHPRRRRVSGHEARHSGTASSTSRCTASSVSRSR